MTIFSAKVNLITTEMEFQIWKAENLLIEEVQHSILTTSERDIAHIETSRLTSHRRTDHWHCRLNVVSWNLASRWKATHSKGSNTSNNTYAVSLWTSCTNHPCGWEKRGENSLPLRCSRFDWEHGFTYWCKILHFLASLRNHFSHRPAPFSGDQGQ